MLTLGENDGSFG